MRISPTELFATGRANEPDVYTAGAVLSPAIDCKGYEWITVWAQAGTLGASATIDMKLTHATTSAGTYADISGAAIVQMTQAGTDQSDTISEPVTVKIDDNRRYVKISLTVGTATSDAGTFYVLSGPKSAPV